MTYRAVVALLMAGLMVSVVQAGPPEGKGPGHNQGAEHRGNGNSGHGHPGRGNQKHDNRDHHRHERQRDSIDALIEAGITAAMAREYAHSYNYRGHSSLPPGIRKNLMRGKPLPPGIAKKVQSGRFLEHLPRYSGYEWQQAGVDLVLVSIASGVIADILYDVFD